MHALQNHAVRRTVAMLTTQHLLRKDELSSNYNFITWIWATTCLL